MKKLLLLSGLFIFLGTLNAQDENPVIWEYTVNRLSDTEAELIATATIEEGWHVYSNKNPETSPVYSTDIAFEDTSIYSLDGKIKEPEPIEEFDPNFDEVLKYHEHKATFKQRIIIHTSEDFQAQGELVFMACNDRMCLPPEFIDVVWDLKGAKNPADAEKLDIDYGEVPASTDEEGSAAAEGDSDPQASRSLIAIFILSFLGGLAALLTPCVFPMIPLTVSFFTKQSKTKAKGISNAIIYGLSIIVLYVALGYLITALFGPDALNIFATDPYVNIGFFVLLVVFAISFFGAFELTLPSSWINKADRASDKGGILGIFFMAFTLALVSFSCTGPIIGTLLFEAFNGGVMGPLVGMFGFSLALALPFALFAAFPGWLNSLPKSGGWLNSVKVTLGFIELAFAFKFLSTADLVWQAGILQREWFITIWIAIFGFMTLYLLGKFRMPHDSPLEKLSVSRMMIALLSFAFTIYLIPGLWGAPLKLISGFPPPMFYSESPQGIGGSSGGVAHGGEDVPPGSHPETCPHFLNCFHDYEQGLAYAKQVGKPVMLDFTGWGCVNCRKMEEQVWSNPEVLSILRNDVVLISLYVDERDELPKEEQRVSDVTGKKIKTVGNKWAEFQYKHFQTQSQPQYIILGHNDMKPLTPSTAYDPDIPKYVKWLKDGIAKFEENN